MSVNLGRRLYLSTYLGTPHHKGKTLSLLAGRQGNGGGGGGGRMSAPLNDSETDQVKARFQETLVTSATLRRDSSAISDLIQGRHFLVNETEIYYPESIVQVGPQPGMFCEIRLNKRYQQANRVFGRVCGVPTLYENGGIFSIDLLVPRLNLEPISLNIPGGRILDVLGTWYVTIWLWCREQELQDLKNEDVPIRSLPGDGTVLRVCSYEHLVPSRLRLSPRQLPWVGIVSSRWLERMPDSRRELALGKLETLIRADKRGIINYQRGSDFDLNEQLGLSDCPECQTAKSFRQATLYAKNKFTGFLARPIARMWGGTNYGDYS